MPPLLTIDEALALVLQRAQPLEAEVVLVAQAAGRVPADDVQALVDLPPFRSSAMDGFAVRVADTPGRLRVVARIPAGRPAERALAAGETMGIATGGSVPDGADAVVPIERVEDGGDEVAVSEGVSDQDNIRSIGSDIRVGDPLLSAGLVLGPAQIGALAAAGVAELRCARRPRVAILSTGTELRPPGTVLEPGQIYESNAPMLAAALESSGAEVTRLAAVADDPDAHRAALKQGLEADVLVSSGGVSVGPHDLVRRIAAELGVEEVFWGVAVKPGKPVAFGVRGRTLVFGLPGNPVSALVACELFVRPALRALQGVIAPGPAYAVGRLATPLRANSGRDELVRACVRIEAGETVLEPLSGQESHMIARAAGADALVLVRRGERDPVSGDRLPFLRLS
ncbi:MAG: molybdopterin molybdotransferase MoeA [Gaiellaceae bacterium MAG52_C11]|nr:molybdopterin molybdotransferase MoeA [Candidatus Gaiellasilicea maunaloa]